MIANYIKKLSEASRSRYGEKIIEMLDYFGVGGIKDLSEEEIKYYVEEKESEQK